MKGVAVSNIAWTPEEDSAIAGVLREHGVSAIELAPTAWRDDPYAAPRPDVLALRCTWEDRGLSIVSLQSLLFGRPELQLFGDPSSRRALRRYLEGAVDFAQALGARTLVFGSPKNRRRGDIPPNDAMRIATDFFRGLAAYAHARETTICLEANPPAYGCDFIVTTAEAVELCRAVDHLGLRVNGDLGGMAIGGEDAAHSISECAPWLGHFHASEPELAALHSTERHASAGTALRLAGYTGWVSIEMRRAASGSNVDAVRDAVRLARKAYLSP